MKNKKSFIYDRKVRVPNDVPNDIVKVLFDSSVTEVRERRFAERAHLKEVTFNEGLQKIGDGAFDNCVSLECIELPSTMIEIAAGAFLGCTSLRRVVLNEGFKRIANGFFGGVFEGCVSLECIELPSTLTEMGPKAFDGCTNLRQVVLNEGLQPIGCQAFRNCKSLGCIELPSTLTEIGFWAFKRCRNLRQVALNEGLQRMEWGAFEGCKSLECIEIPSTLTEVGREAFKGCTNLRQVVLNEGLQRIGGRAFEGCESLECIELPSTMIEVSQLAFGGCSNLREVRLNQRLKSIEPDAFPPTLEYFKLCDVSEPIQNITQASQNDFHETIEVHETIEGHDLRLITQLVESDESDLNFLEIKVQGGSEGSLHAMIKTYYEKFKCRFIDGSLWKRIGEAIKRSKSLDLLGLHFEINSPMSVVDPTVLDCLGQLYEGLKENTSVAQLHLAQLCPEIPIFDMNYFMRNNNKLKDLHLSYLNFLPEQLQSGLRNCSLELVNICGPIDIELNTLIVQSCVNVQELRLGVTIPNDAVAELLQNPASKLEKLSVCNIKHDELSLLARSLVGNKKLTQLKIHYIHSEATFNWGPFKTLLCDTSSIDSIQNSNHTLTHVEYDNTAKRDQAVPEYLELNMLPNENEVIREKIARYYFVGDFDLSPFVNMHVTLLPSILGLIEGGELIQRNAIFRMLRIIPDLCDVNQRHAEETNYVNNGPRLSSRNKRQKVGI